MFFVNMMYFCCCFQLGTYLGMRLLCHGHVCVHLGGDISQQFPEVVVLIYVLCSSYRKLEKLGTFHSVVRLNAQSCSGHVGGLCYVPLLCIYLTSSCLSTSFHFSLLF